MALIHGGQIEFHLIGGCRLEADRAELISFNLQGLHLSLAEPPQSHLAKTAQEVRSSARLLRELADLSINHYTRLPVVVDYLEILLPCLSRSLRDITGFYEDRKLSKENRWRKMFHSMTDEADGLMLPGRFILYNHYLTLVKELLTRSPHFDFNAMETVRLQVMQLREARNIPPPPLRVGSVVHHESTLDDPAMNPSIHWAEHIFSLPLTSRTALKNIHPSTAFGPHLPWSDIQMPSDVKVLFMRPFNEHQISLVVYISARDEIPHFLLRTYHMGGPWFSVRAAHELCVDRDGGSLQFWQWSESEGCARRWASLCFQTWEELVLLHCTFLSLRARIPYTPQITPSEFAIRGEIKLFQARIVDDDFRHSLIVYQDAVTKGIRLHTAVWDGELRQCPVWTAFVTHQSTSPTWIKRVSRYKVRLMDVQLYVFCQDYRHVNQRRGAAGAFEICFVSEEAAQRFRELFSVAPASTVASSETTGSNI